MIFSTEICFRHVRFADQKSKSLFYQTKSARQTQPRHDIHVTGQMRTAIILQVYLQQQKFCLLERKKCSTSTDEQNCLEIHWGRHWKLQTFKKFFAQEQKCISINLQQSLCSRLYYDRKQWHEFKKQIPSEIQRLEQQKTEKIQALHSEKIQLFTRKDLKLTFLSKSQSKLMMFWQMVKRKLWFL